MARPKLPPGETHPKATKLEVKRRVQEVYKMLLSGIARAEIIQYVTEPPKPGAPNPINRPWDVEDRQIDHYIARATKQFEALAAVERDAEFGKAKARFEYLYKNTINVQDWKTALAVEKARCDLLGLNAPQKREVTGKDGGAIQQTNVNIPAENAHDASDILKQLAELGAIPSGAGAAGHDTEAE